MHEQREFNEAILQLVDELLEREARDRERGGGGGGGGGGGWGGEGGGGGGGCGKWSRRTTARCRRNAPASPTTRRSSLPRCVNGLEVEVAPRGKRVNGDVGLYHMGNDPTVHGWILEQLRRRPGVVVLHDFVLHHLVAGLTLGAGPRRLSRGDGTRGRRRRAAPSPGRHRRLRPSALGCAARRTFRSAARSSSWRRVSSCIPTWTSGVRGTTGTTARPACVDACLARAGGPARRRRGLAAVRRFRPHERGEALPAAAPRLRRASAPRPAEARLLLVGSVASELDLDRRIDHAGLVDAIVREDRVSEERLWSLLARVDAVVSLRSPTMGETSAMVVRALTLGKPVIVCEVGSSPSCLTASRSRSRPTSTRSTASSPR